MGSQLYDSPRTVFQGRMQQFPGKAARLCKTISENRSQDIGIISVLQNADAYFFQKIHLKYQNCRAMIVLFVSELYLSI
jgi:hypothetical protein